MPATGNAGLELSTGATPTLATAVTVTAAAVLTGTLTQPVPTLTAPVDGLGLTKRQFYVALREALDLLAGIQVQQLYVPDDDDVQKRRLFRRITVGPNERLRTASERIALLDLSQIGRSVLAVQQRHDEAFDVESVTREFFSEYPSAGAY